MARDSPLDRRWDSRWRPVRDLAAAALVVAVAAGAPYLLLGNALAGTDPFDWPAVLGTNAGLVLVTVLWSIVVLGVYGGRLRAAFRDYRRHF